MDERTVVKDVIYNHFPRVVNGSNRSLVLLSSGDCPLVARVVASFLVIDARQAFDCSYEQTCSFDRSVNGKMVGDLGAGVIYVVKNKAPLADRTRADEVTCGLLNQRLPMLRVSLIRFYTNRRDVRRTWYM